MADLKTHHDWLQKADTGAPPALVATGVTDEGTGDIGIDFDVARDRVVSLTIYADGTVGWSALVGEQRGHGKGPLPAWVREALLTWQRPVDPPDLVALVQEWQATRRAWLLHATDAPAYFAAEKDLMAYPALTPEQEGR